MTNLVALDQIILNFNPDDYTQPAIALHLEAQYNDVEQPVHKHCKGQLLISLRGGVIGKVSGMVWIVPPQHAIWIPSGMLHSNKAADNAELYFLFIDPNAIDMPKECCTLAISPLLRELIKHLATQPSDYSSDSATYRLVTVLLEQLVDAPIQQLNFPLSENPKIKYIAESLLREPSNRMTLSEWADYLAMTERTLARLIKQETTFTFGRWRQQLHILVALSQLSDGFNVQQISGNLGYDSVTAFITMFKKSLGCTPTQYFSRLK